MPVPLSELTRYLDDYLRIAAVRDYPEAINGLQVANGGQVARVAAAVDLCRATVRMAAAQGATLLLVHHGLFWGGLRPLTGPSYERVRLLLAHDIALYSAHLPLDCHPVVGNAAVLARRLGLRVCGPVADRNGQDVGFWGECGEGDRGTSRDEFSLRLDEALGASARLLPFGPERVRRVGIVTGGAGSMIPLAAALGLDTFVTGEGPHHTFFDAEELGLNVYFGGHYRTETFGVKALGEHVAETFSLPWSFLDHPTGM